MPLDLTPILDLTPLDEEESTPERQDYVSPPPPMPTFGEGPEDIPPGMTPGPAPHLSGEEWERLRSRIGLQEEKAVPVEKTFVETISEPIAEAQEGLVSPEEATRAIGITTPALARFPGTTRAIGEAASGFTSPMNMLMLGAGGEAAAIPKIGMGIVRGIAGGFTADMARHIPALWRATQEAKTPEEKQKAWTDLAITGGMTTLGGLGTVLPAPRAQAPVPPRIQQVIREANDKVPDALNKTKQAVAEIIDVEAKVEPATKEVASAEAIRSDPGQVREAGRQPEVVQDQGRQDLQQPAPEPAQPVGAQAGQSAEVLLSGPEVIKSIVELPDAEAGNLRQKPAVEAGMKLTEADVPALEAARAKTMREATDAAEAGNNDAFKAAFGKNIWFSGAIEGARRKGPNYDTFIKEQKAAGQAQPDVASAGEQAARSPDVQPESIPANQRGAAPTSPEVVTARPVGGEPAGQPAVGAVEVPASFVWKGADLGREPVIAFRQQDGTVLADPSARIHASAAMNMGLGGSTTAGALQPGFVIGKKFVPGSQAGDMGAVRAAGRAQPFFERESEVGGLGRSSLPPTVADVRAQRVADTRQRASDAAAESGYVPDTAGETVKMRKSAERAVESPQIPEPVQERIEAAPESRYTQQSMARVDDAVKTMSDADLAATPADSNLFVASKLEQADRRFRAGDNDGGYAIFVELEKQGTSFGQNINQFKRLAGTRPEYVATVIDKHLTKAGKDALTPDQRATAIETTRKSKEADLALDKATDAWTKKPTAENALKAEAALDKANAEAVELQKFVGKFQPRGFWSLLKSILQGTLLTPISETANLFGNMSFAPWRAGERTTAAGIDMIDATIRNRPREIIVQPLVGTLEALKGAGRGLKKVPDILIEGTGNVIKGETRAGLHPIKAWINQFAKNPEMPTTRGKLTLQDRLNLAIEGTFGVPAEAMLRGLGAGDAPFKEAARARSTATQLKLKNVPRDQWPFAHKFPELFLDKPALEQIGKDTAAAVFQRESKTLNVITNWLHGKGEIVDFLAATVAPYKLTPWNIIGEIMSYNPLIAMTRGAIDAKKGNTRAAKLNAGKMVVGSMLTGAGVWLYNKGLLAPSLDQRDEAQKGRVLAGEVLPPNHINISGLKRALEGGDSTFKAGDETADIMRGGGLAGSIFYMTANIGREFERQPEVDQSDMWLAILRQSTLEQARFGMNQSFLSGVEGLLTAIKDGNSDNYVRQWANTVASIPLPNTLNTISRASREYKPDVSKDFPAQIKSKLGVFGLNDYLPLKRDFWGEPMRETPEGRNAIFYHFFDISKNKQVTSDPVELELYRLWRKTANSEVIPSIPTRKLTIENQEYPLTPNLYEKYAEVVGKNRREIVDAMVINPNFHELTDEQKIDVLERAYRDGLARGKALFHQEHQSELVPKAGRAGFNSSTQ